MQTTNLEKCTGNTLTKKASEECLLINWNISLKNKLVKAGLGAMIGLYVRHITNTIVPIGSAYESNGNTVRISQMEQDSRLVNQILNIKSLR